MFSVPENLKLVDPKLNKKLRVQSLLTNGSIGQVLLNELQILQYYEKKIFKKTFGSKEKTRRFYK